MVTRILPILLLLLIAAAWIIDRCELRHRIATHWRCVFWLPNVFLAAALIYMSIGESYTIAADIWKQRLLTCTLLIGVTETVYALLYLTRSLFIRMVAALIVFGALLYGFTLGWQRLSVVEYSHESQTLPKGFDGYRIAQVSDMHLGTLRGHEAFVEKFCESINAQKPDLVVVSGDVVNYHPEEFERMKHILSRIHATDGIISILGNHDYLAYHHWQTAADSAKAMERLKKAQREIGWELLENKTHILHHNGDSIILVGLENDGPPRFPDRADKKLTQTTAKQPFAIFLEHDPSYWKRVIVPMYERNKAEQSANTPVTQSLTLSGHTHAMQLRLLGWSPASWFYDEWGGTYVSGNATLYVSQGIGSVLLPFRLGAWPEINIITLHHKP